jgi:glutathione-independent formaldehyde dehydrogenase
MAGVKVPYIAGAGPVGLACASSCQLLGAAIVIVGDLNEERLAHARSFGCETINLTNGIPVQEQIAMIVGIPEVDCFVDCVGFEASGTVDAGKERAVVLNQAMAITRAGGSIGIQVVRDGRSGATDEASKQGSLKIRFGLGWAKSHSFHTGQTPVMKYHRQLMNAILNDKINTKAVNAEV